MTKSDRTALSPDQGWSLEPLGAFQQFVYGCPMSRSLDPSFARTSPKDLGRLATLDEKISWICSAHTRTFRTLVLYQG